MRFINCEIEMKIKPNRHKLILIALSLLAVYIFGCDYGKIKQQSTSGELFLIVDENISPVIKRASEEFIRLNKEAKMNLKVKTSNEVIADLVNGDAKTVISSRDFSVSEKELIEQNKIDIKKNVFALDGLGVIVNPNNSIRKATFKEIKKVFSGEISDWKDLDGDNKDLYKGKIKVFIARKNSVTHDFFKEKVLNGIDYSKASQICSTSSQILDEIRKNDNAIGFITMGWITKSQDTLDSTIKALKIAGVDNEGRMSYEYVGFHQAYIADRSYPLVMEAFIMSRDFSMNLSIGFTSFMLGYDGQKIVLVSGLVPVTQPIKIIQLK